MKLDCLFSYFLQKLTLYDDVDWVGGRPPVSHPPCGFFGEKCQRESEVSNCLSFFV
jgi:hypothetical protein